MATETAIQARRTRNGKFLPGVSGNPKGRARGLGRATVSLQEVKAVIADFALAVDSTTARPRVMEAAQRLYDSNPERFLELVIKLIPKDIDMTVGVATEPGSWSELMILARSGPVEDVRPLASGQLAAAFKALPEPDPNLQMIDAEVAEAEALEAVTVATPPPSPGPFAETLAVFEDLPLSKPAPTRTELELMRVEPETEEATVTPSNLIPVFAPPEVAGEPATSLPPDVAEAPAADGADWDDL